MPTPTLLQRHLQLAKSLVRSAFTGVSTAAEADPLLELSPRGDHPRGVVRLPGGVPRLIKVIKTNIGSNERRREGRDAKKTMLVLTPDGARSREYHRVQIMGPSLLVYTEEEANEAIGCGPSQNGSVHVHTSAELLAWKTAPRD